MWGSFFFLNDYVHCEATSDSAYGPSGKVISVLGRERTKAAEKLEQFKSPRFWVHLKRWHFVI